MMLDTGLVRLPGRSLDRLDSIAFAGEGVTAVADAFARAGAPRPVIESDHFVLSSRVGEPPSVGRVRDLPAGSVDLVVLRRAWSEPRAVGEALRIARSRVVPGGEVIAADLDVQKLLAGPTPRYPVRLFYLAAPEAADGLAASTASPALMSAAAVRAGLRPVQSLTYDDIRSSHETTAELWDALRRRGWRGAAWTPAQRQRAVVDMVAVAMESLATAGSADDREPWVGIVGSVQ